MLGKKILCNTENGIKRVLTALSNGYDNHTAWREVKQLRDVMFLSHSPIGSLERNNDVRNYVADVATCTNQLVPPTQHVLLHARRAAFILQMYWQQAPLEDLSPTVVKGLRPEFGYYHDRTVLLVQYEAVISKQKGIFSVLLSCQCKGGCSSLRPFVNSGQNCVGCQCNDLLYRNQLLHGNGLDKSSIETKIAENNGDRSSASHTVNEAAINIIDDEGTDSDSQSSQTRDAESLSSINTVDADMDDLLAVL